MTTSMDASNYYLKIINKAIEAGETLKPYTDGEVIGGLFTWAREYAPKPMAEYTRLEARVEELIRKNCEFNEYKKSVLAAGKALIKIFEAKAEASKTPATA